MATVIFGSSGCVGKSLCEFTMASKIDHIGLNSSKLDLLASNAASQISNHVSDGDDIVILSALTPEKAPVVDSTTANIVMMRNILAGLKSIQFRHLIYISTDAVYSHAIETIKQDSPKNPERLYGYAHLVREEMLKHEFEPSRWCILRPCAIYGQNDTHNAYGVMRFMREALDKGTITLFGNGEEFRDHVHADDVVAIIDKAVSSRVSGEFNVSSGQSVSFANMASMIAKRSEIPIEVKSVARQSQITHRFIENTVLLLKAKSTPGRK